MEEAHGELLDGVLVANEAKKPQALALERLNEAELERLRAKGIALEFSSGCDESTAQLLVRGAWWAERLSDRFERFYREYISNDESLRAHDKTGAVREKLKEKGLLRPRFRLMTPDIGVAQLAEWGFASPNDTVYEREVDDDLPVTANVYAVFKLPKQLDWWWYKGMGSWGQRGIDVQRQVFEWGRQYRELLPVVWEAVDGAPHSRARLGVERINGNEEHVSGEYYYIWRFFEGSNNYHNQTTSNGVGKQVFEALFSRVAQKETRRRSS